MTLLGFLMPDKPLPCIDKASFDSLARVDARSPRGVQLLNAFSSRLRTQIEECLRSLSKILPDSLLDFVICLSLMLHPNARDRLDAEGVMTRMKSLQQDLMSVQRLRCGVEMLI